VQNTDRLLGVPLRSAVFEHLPKTLGCPRLNDALRTLAEVPMMLDALNRAWLKRETARSKARLHPDSQCRCRNPTQDARIAGYESGRASSQQGGLSLPAH